MLAASAGADVQADDRDSRARLLWGKNRPRWRNRGGRLHSRLRHRGHDRKQHRRSSSNGVVGGVGRAFRIGRFSEREREKPWLPATAVATFC